MQTYTKDVAFDDGTVIILNGIKKEYSYNGMTRIDYDKGSILLFENKLKYINTRELRKD